MPSVFLFTGENAHALRQERRRWTAEFERKHGRDNFVVLEGGKMTVRSLLDEVSVMPFLAEKRLVFVEGLPKFTKEQAESIRNQIHPAVLLVFIDTPKVSSGGKRKTAASKDLHGLIEQTKEFPKMQSKGVRDWVMQTITGHGGKIRSDAVETLLELVGEDQDMLASEIEKLALYAHGREITRADVEEMAAPSFEGVIWRITDLLTTGKRDQALAFARRYLSRGGDAYMLWNVLLSSVKNLILVWSAAREGNRNMNDIASSLKVPFFSVRMLLPYASRVQSDSVRALLSRAIRDDIDLKTGNIRATDEAPQELHALIDRLIMAFPK